VGKRVELELDDEWGGCDRRSQIVFIGAADIDGHGLRGRFATLVEQGTLA
jgi:hypothetical protein